MRVARLIVAVMVSTLALLTVQGTAAASDNNNTPGMTHDGPGMTHDGTEMTHD